MADLYTGTLLPPGNTLYGIGRHRFGRFDRLPFFAFYERIADQYFPYFYQLCYATALIFD